MIPRIEPTRRARTVIPARRAALVLAVMGLLLPGCAMLGHRHAPPTTEAPPPEPPPPPPPPPGELSMLPPGATGSSGPAGPHAPGPILGTQFVGPEADLGPIPAVTLLLKPGDRARNIALCQGFTGIAGLAQAQADHPNALVIPLRWLLTRASNFTTPACDEVVEHYDYFRAGTILGALATTTTAPGKAALDFSGRGPFLIEQFVDANGSHYLFVEFSRFTDAQLTGVGPLIARALVQQSDVLTSNAQLGGSPDPAAHAAAASKSSMPGWLRRVCGVATSPLVHIAKILFAAVFPPTLAVITPLEAVTNAGCPAAA